MKPDYIALISWAVSVAVVGLPFLYWLRNPHLTQMQVFLAWWPLMAGGFVALLALLVYVLWKEARG